MTHLNRSLVSLLLLAFLGVGLLLPVTARASEEGRRNTTYALGAATAYFLAKKDWVPAAVAGIGTAVAFHNYQALINARHRREHRLAYRHAYRLGLLHGYRRHRYVALR